MGVRRHLRTLRIALDTAFPEEDWGFPAQQAAEKRIKAWLVLADQRPPRLNNSMDLAALAERSLDPRLAALQVFAIEARYEEGPFPLPAARAELLALLEAELARCEQAVEAAG